MRLVSRLKGFAASLAVRMAVVAVPVVSFASGAMAQTTTYDFTPPTGFDVPTIMNDVLNANKALVLGGLGAVAFFRIFGRVVKKVTMGSANNAGGR